MNHQQVIDIPTICHAHGVRHAVISPGSRNALLSVSFQKFNEINTYIIPDERSAGNIALGIAQSSTSPVVLICTSGSAVYQYGGAVAEAWFMNNPLIIISADRPDEWIDQQDGQTIRQKDIFKDHTKVRYHLPVDTTHCDAKWHFERSVNEAIIVSKKEPCGPVHLNIPIREPFYDSLHKLKSSEQIKMIESPQITNTLPSLIFDQFIDIINASRKVLIVIGQKTNWTEAERINIEKISQYFVVVADIIANCPSNNTIRHHDLILENEENTKNLQPDLIVSFGKSVLSKPLKRFLRKSKNTTHWHFSNCSFLSDPFQNIGKFCQVQEKIILEKFPKANKNQHEYYALWHTLNNITQDYVGNFISQEKYNSLSIVNKIIESTTEDSVLHLSNSMTVRYANFLGRTLPFEIYCNRGTSGLDTSNGTAVGHSMVNGKNNVLITGDIAFLYDTNAFWNNYLKENLMIFVLNDQGGGIFDIIPGPSSQEPDIKEVFTSPYQRDLEKIAQFHHFNYKKVESLGELQDCLDTLYLGESSKTIVDIKLDMKENTQSFKEFKKTYLASS